MLLVWYGSILKVGRLALVGVCWLWSDRGKVAATIYTNL